MPMSRENLKRLKNTDFNHLSNHKDSSTKIITLSNNQKTSEAIMGVNSVTLVGRAGRDPEVRYFESGTVVANLTMAVNRRSRDDEPDWFNLEIWGKQAQVAADYVKKGSLIGITGSFKLDSWQDRNTGEERNKPVVRVDRLELLGSKRDSENSNFQNNNSFNQQPSNDEIPF